jgi:hypothetical protein
MYRVSMDTIMFFETIVHCDSYIIKHDSLL